MSFEGNPKPNQDRNYEVCRSEEVFIGSGTEYTIPASLYIGSLSSEKIHDHELGIPSYLKVIAEKPCNQTDGSAVMIYEVDSRVSGRMDGNLYMLSEDDLDSARMAASVADLERVAQPIPESGTETLDPSNSFKVKSNSEGDVTVTGCSEAGTVLIVPASATSIN